MTHALTEARVEVTEPVKQHHTHSAGKATHDRAIESREERHT